MAVSLPTTDRFQVDVLNVGEIADDGIPDDGPFDAGIVADGHMR